MHREDNDHEFEEDPLFDEVLYFSDGSDDSDIDINIDDSEDSVLDLISDSEEEFRNEMFKMAMSDDLMDGLKSGHLLLISRDDYQYLMGVIAEKKDERRAVRREIRKEKKALKSILGEFLSCYIVVGYDLNGNNVELTNALNEQSEDSLTTAIQKFTINYMTKHMPGM